MVKPEGRRPDQWSVIVSDGLEQVIVNFTREDTAKHFVEHGQRAGVWIANRFVSDPSLQILAPEA